MALAVVAQMCDVICCHVLSILESYLENKDLISHCRCQLYDKLLELQPTTVFIFHIYGRFGIPL